MSWQTDPAQDSEDHGDGRVAEKIAEAVDDLIAGRRTVYHGYELADLGEDPAWLPEAIQLLEQITSSSRDSIARLEAIAKSHQFIEEVRRVIIACVQEKAEAAIRAAWAQSWEP